MTTAKAAPSSEERTYTESDLVPILETLFSWRDGDFRRRVPHAPPGILSEVRLLLNEVADRREHLANELVRVRKEVVKEGRFGERLTPGPGVGAWAESVESVNMLIDALVSPVSGAADVIDAVAKGDLSRRIDLDRSARGEVRRLGKAINGMVDQLALFNSEVTRVAREAGTEGRLGGSANLRGMSGSWRDLTEAVNTMSSRVAAQVRDIAVVTTAVAKGDLSRKVTVDAVGEMFELKNTVNTMVDQLSGFAEEVTRVAREVGTEGQLGGQAQVTGVSGVWKDLTDNVNFMANNLTSQVRSIATVATAVAQGNLSKKITVDAQGEILQLKDTLNTMVDQLPHRQRQLHGQQPHLPGAQHRPGHHGRGQRRPHPQDRRRRAGRDPRAQVDHEHDGRAALVVRLRGDPRGPRGRHGRPARRPGAGARRVRGLEGPHRQRQLDGQQPDLAGAPDRGGVVRGGPGQPVEEDHR